MGCYTLLLYGTDRLPGPLLYDGQIGELGRACKYVGHHRLNGLQPLLAARVLLARTRLLFALEHDQGVELIRVLLWSRMSIVRSRPEPGCSTTRICSLSPEVSVPDFTRILTSTREQLKDLWAMNATTIATVSIVISAIALVGATVSLIFQARQLRISLLQSLRTMHAESTRMAFDHPEIVAKVEGDDDPELVAKSVYVNWNMQHMKMSFLLRSTPRDLVRTEAELMFKAPFVRDFWKSARPVYKMEARSRRENEFVKIVDDVFRQVALLQEHDDNLSIDTSSISPSEPESQP